MFYLTCAVKTSLITLCKDYDPLFYRLGIKPRGNDLSCCRLHTNEGEMNEGRRGRERMRERKRERELE